MQTKPLTFSKGEKMKTEDFDLVCPKCGNKYVVAKPHVWAPEGKITFSCGICRHWWYKQKNP